MDHICQLTAIKKKSRNICRFSASTSFSPSWVFNAVSLRCAEIHDFFSTALFLEDRLILDSILLSILSLQTSEDLNTISDYHIVQVVSSTKNSLWLWESQISCFYIIFSDGLSCPKCVGSKFFFNQIENVGYSKLRWRIRITSGINLMDCCCWTVKASVLSSLLVPLPCSWPRFLVKVVILAGFLNDLLAPAFSFSWARSEEAYGRGRIWKEGP